MKKEQLIVPTIEYVIPNAQMHKEAAWVSEQTGLAKTMLPKTIDEVLSLFAQGRSVMIMDNNGEPIVHASISFLYEADKTLEIGGLIVAPEMRHKGYAKLATGAILTLANEKYPGWKKVALCNEYSLPLMMKFGAVVVELSNSELLPPSVWEACATCPNLSWAKGMGKICCDTPIIIP